MVIYEIGVGPLSTCRSRQYWDKHECVLFEPLIPYYLEIKEAIGERPNIKLYDIAIYDYVGQCEFIQNEQLSFIKGLNSPQVQRSNHNGQVTQCKCAKLSDFDKGDIDLLLLDMEGAEWFALKYLISRPRKIIVETQMFDYTNPFLKEINKWMGDNNYKMIRRIPPDTIWIKNHKVFL